MRRPWHIWLTFGLCLAVVLAAMGWLTVVVVRLDRAQTQSRREAAFAENVRLALWRMDSALAPLIAQENARPYFAYSAFYPLDRAYARMFQENQDGNVMVPSVLLTNEFPNILLYFQVGPDGQITSPQLPSEAMLEKLAHGKGAAFDKEQFEQARQRLEEFRKIAKPEALAAAFPPALLGQETLVFNNGGLYQQKTIRDFGSLNFANGNAGGNGLNNLSAGLNTAPNSNATSSIGTLNQADTNNRVNSGGNAGQTVNQVPPQQLPQFYLPNQPPGPHENPEQQGNSGNPGVPQGQQQASAQQLGNSTLNVNAPIKEQQQARDNNEFVQRSQAIQANIANPDVSLNNKCPESEGAIRRSGSGGGASNIRETALQAAWVGEALVLVRRVSVDGKEYLQGCWLDWPTIRGWLAGTVTDLLPEVQLAPATPETPGAAARMLATLPVKVEPGPNPIPLDSTTSTASPLRVTLGLAWGGVLLATLAAAVLLQGALSLSERRGAFVSAVTHELRTPLTTFRLYSEMLADGMVTEETRRKSYLGTLRVEADRLSHLVENVLAYARLERGSARGGIRGRAEEITVSALLERLTPRLADRTRQAGMEVVVALPGPAGAATLRTDGAAVEQVLFNLVDNACKYAAGAADKRIVLEGAVEAAAVRWPALRPRPRMCIMLRVRDFGPGISPAEARKLFRPFSKTAREAAHSAPGVGLGLALCRRLARDLGGELALETGDGNGACFALRLPAGIA